MAGGERAGAHDATGPRDAVQAGDRTAPNILELRSDPNVKNGNGRVVASDWMPGGHLNGVGAGSKSPASQDAQIGLAVALALAAVGIKVFPCVHSRNPKKDKKPLVNDWPGVATVDPDQIRAWWDKWPDARVGVPTGPATGLFVLDADVDKDTDEPIGERNLLKLGFDVAGHPWKQRTQRGGWHCFFRWDEGCPGNTASKIAKGVDTRGDRGYFIAYDPDAVLEAVEALHG